MSKTIKTVLAIVGALSAICAVLLLLKKKFGCKKCCKNDCGCDFDLPETVEDFVADATEAAEDKADAFIETVEDVRDAVEDKVEEAKEKAEAIAEEFKDYADVELPNE